MAVKRYDGSQWVTVAGKGDQGTSSSISTWVKTASGGETSLSGNDDNSQSLSYTIGQELVFINGTLLKRGSDYTATNGTSITGLTALAANDVATVWTVNAFSVTGAIANTIVDAKGDILVGTGADTPGRLAVGTNGQVLKADSTTGTGLAWGTDSGKVIQTVYASYAVSTTTSSNAYSDTGLTATITPTSASNKIIVLVTQNGVTKTGLTGVGLRLVRGSTEIAFFANAAGYDGGTGENQVANVSMVYEDSPATTSATTYKTQFKSTDNVATAYVQVSSGRSGILLMEVTP
jgi:hypothetical protein